MTKPEYNLFTFYYPLKSLTASCMYRKASIEYEAYFYELILWERDWKEKGSMWEQIAIMAIDDEEALKKSMSFIYNFMNYD